MTGAAIRPTSADLRRLYATLLHRFGHAAWWPGETPFEVCVGAILVQNTSWKNVETTIARLRRQDRLSFHALHAMPPSRLAPLLRSSGTFRVKARRLRAFLDFLGAEYGGRVEAMRAEPARVLRDKLLRVDGIGRETADSIVLYAVGRPLFVIDAYTRRVLARLGWIEGDEPYDVLQRLFMDRLPPNASLYNDFHAQIVLLGKDVCRPRPRCDACPLADACPRCGVRGPLAPTQRGDPRARRVGRPPLPRRRPGGSRNAR